MLGLELVRPLEDSWRETLDSVARRRGWPTSGDVAALAARVADLSRSYNDPAVARASAADAGAARLGFGFARDVPKGAAAVRELVATGLLRFGAEPLRVLDLGAGLGATTWGATRALAAARGADTKENAVIATWVDSDTRALEVASDIVRARGAVDGLVLRVAAMARSVSSASDVPIRGVARHDLVLVGQILSELDVGLATEARVRRHADLLAALLEHHVDDHGALVVVEPALRDRTRHLHSVRDAMVAGGRFHVFAPCLHGAPCPALARETDWCHEDLAVDLPRWLVPVARAAGLRREGLTFSYLVLRRDGSNLLEHIAARSSAARVRVVSDLMRSKGKREAFVCGEFVGVSGELEVGRFRTTRLDRDERETNAGWEAIVRGDLLIVDPSPEPSRPRIVAESSIRTAEGSEAADRIPGVARTAEESEARRHRRESS